MSAGPEPGDTREPTTPSGGLLRRNPASGGSGSGGSRRTSATTAIVLFVEATRGTGVAVGAVGALLSLAMLPRKALLRPAKP